MEMRKKYYTFDCNISKTPTNGGVTLEVNSRFVMAMISTRKAFADIKTFCNLNILPSIKKDTYQKQQNDINEVSTKCAHQSMSPAAQKRKVMPQVSKLSRS